MGRWTQQHSRWRAMPHKHECPECGQIWQHTDPMCSEPFSSLWPEWAICADCDGRSYSGAELDEMRPE